MSEPSAALSLLEVAIDLAKLGGGGIIGYLFSQGKSKAKEATSALALIEKLSRDAEISMRANIHGVPDHALSIGVMTDRTTLRTALVDTFGKTNNFQEIESAFVSYASSLKYADPFLGGTLISHIDDMRTAETNLKRVFRSHAKQKWYWLLRRQEVK